MTALSWDAVGERHFETGVDRGVLYIPDVSGAYADGYAWNGLTTVTESPSGAESNPQYADNIKYLNLVSAEEFGGTIEAFTYPDEFAQCDGTAAPQTGVFVGQQSRKMFGLSYRTKIGNDVDGTAHGFKIHCLYGLQASPSEKAYGTINDSPEAIAFSWEVASTPVNVTNLAPTSLIVVDSTKVSSANMTALTDLLWGSAGGDARLPLPDELISMFAGTLTKVDLGVSTNQPTYVSGTHIVTLPSVTGVQWKVNGVNKSAGAQPALTTGQTAQVEATPQAGYYLEGDTDWTFDY
jgi:hypothetical protein